MDQEVLTKYQSDQLLSGRTKFELGQYVITDWIGQGGMGQVFKGIHQVMGRECAVKVLPSSRATQEAKDIVAKATEATKVEREKQLASLKSDFGKLVISATGKVTGKVLTSEDQEKINKETATQLAN